MAEENFLDKALGLISSAYNARRENRDELMQAILPEVLQPEELKQAAAKPLKEEASKSLHAPKYDRRMKFNTALERSQNQMTSEEPLVAKEEPAWLKEAVRKIAGDPDFDGITGREGVVTVEDELERTPPLPIEEPMSYDVANKPVMQKSALYPDETETFTQRNPWVLPVGVGLLGAAAGAIPAGLLGGRHAVKMLQKMHGSRRGVLEQELADAVRASRNANNNWKLTQRKFDDIKEQVKKVRTRLKDMPEPNYAMHRGLGRVGGGTLGGLTGGSLGVLGGLELNRPQPWEQ